ncbi:class Ib ribonucleoside-diphosphate reductase assembly flavoprotein NrdI [Bifidobacterium sp. AGR2158]|uniref:class Ib ribonucleoside-diphosphate reductase assembly flavoprotein NrdI n=1 Tax=Bifidobacterium sp. AGR2158 TaxID=1280675 RepID=UPI0004284843|nr:class Ib ribonucleoside-diphosphate reductase assembly flavoprotein NrdI [Bifidobacterium sp. AGR2158]
MTGTVVYFSSASRNTERFVEQCDFPSHGVDVRRIPLVPAHDPLHVDAPYILIVPTYGGGDARKAVPPQVKRFLNDQVNRSWIRGVIASGNTNFGEAYAAAGPIIAAKCHVPLMYRFELMGTARDVATVTDGVTRFFSSAPQ